MKLMPDLITTLSRRTGASARRQAPAAILSGLILLFFVIFFWNQMVISIHPGQLGVLYKRLGAGTVVDTVYREGLHIIFPFNAMYIYDVRKQQFNDAIEVLTLDGLTLRVQYTVRYYLDKDTLPLLHQRVGPDYVKVVVKPDVRSIIRTVFGQYKPEEIYTSQKAIQERISDLAKVRLAARFVALDDVPIESITLPTRISQAIEAKMVQQQIDAEYDFRLSITKKEAERQRIESDGTRVYNDTVNKSLTPAVLEWQGILATRELAKSPNAKVVVIGAGKSGLPIILGKD
jgi:regulator of protease activity HflC (stomatin/prohibitin superfamily)